MMDRAMRVVAFIGPSNSGKTRLICALIRHFVTAGQTVAAIKHTHHPLNEDRKGDTAAFEDAGASPVILAGDGEAVISATRRITFSVPSDLLAHTPADVVLVEGFKTYDGWPRLNATNVSFEEAVLFVMDRIP